MSRPLALILAAAVVAGGIVSAALVVSPAGASTTAPKAHITAKPNSIMVNDTTKLTGKNFPASKKLTIVECSQSTYVVMSNPCDTNNKITVKTNTKGQFQAVFTVHTCPATTAAPPGETCYIGEPEPSGVDTITLVGAATITVTVP